MKPGRRGGRQAAPAGAEDEDDRSDDDGEWAALLELPGPAWCLLLQHLGQRDVASLLRTSRLVQEQALKHLSSLTVSDRACLPIIDYRSLDRLPSLTCLTAGPDVRAAALAPLLGAALSAGRQLRSLSAPHLQLPYADLLFLLRAYPWESLDVALHVADWYHGHPAAGAHRGAQASHLLSVLPARTLTTLRVASAPLLRDMGPLAQLTALTSLSLCSCDLLTDHDLQPLGNLPRLASFSLEASPDAEPLTGRGLAHLAPATALTHLALWCQLSEPPAAAAALGLLRSLKEIVLGHPDQPYDAPLGHDIVAALAGLPALESLTLDVSLHLDGPIAAPAAPVAGRKSAFGGDAAAARASGSRRGNGGGGLTADDLAAQFSRRHWSKPLGRRGGSSGGEGSGAGGGGSSGGSGTQGSDQTESDPDGSDVVEDEGRQASKLTHGSRNGRHGGTGSARATPNHRAPRESAGPGGPSTRPALFPALQKLWLPGVSAETGRHLFACMRGLRSLTARTYAPPPADSPAAVLLAAQQQRAAAPASDAAAASSGSPRRWAHRSASLPVPSPTAALAPFTADTPLMASRRSHARASASTNGAAGATARHDGSPTTPITGGHSRGTGRRPVGPTGDRGDGGGGDDPLMVLPASLAADGLQHLGLLPRLTSLALVELPQGPKGSPRLPDDDALCHLARTGLSRALRVLHTGGSFTDLGLTVLAEVLPHLREVELQRVPGVTEAGVMALAVRPNMARLSLFKCGARGALLREPADRARLLGLLGRRGDLILDVRG